MIRLKLVLIFVLIVRTTLLSAQDGDFWEKFEIFNSTEKYSKKLTMKSYPSDDSDEPFEIQMANLYRKGDYSFFSALGTMAITDGDLAVQVTEANKTVFLARSIKLGKDELSGSPLGLIAALKELHTKGEILMTEKDGSYVLSTKPRIEGKFSSIEWYFNNGAAIDLQKIVVRYNTTFLYKESQGSGEPKEVEYKNARVEISFEPYDFTPPRASAIVAKDKSNYTLTPAYAGYELIDMTNPHEVRRTP